VPVPIVDESDIQANVADYQPLVTLIEDLKCHFSDAINPQPITTHASSLHVSFGSHAVNAIVTAHSDCHSVKYGLMYHDIAFYHDQHIGFGPDE
jgi:hypothetical protein